MCVFYFYSYVLYGSYGVICMNEFVIVLCGGVIVDNSYVIIRCVLIYIYYFFKVSMCNCEMWVVRIMCSSYFVFWLVIMFFCFYLFLI